MTTMMHNTEFKNQVRKVIWRLDAAKPYIEDEDCGSCRRSRRVPGLWTTSGERHGYRHVYCYIEKGLEDKFDIVASFLTLLLRYLRDNSYSSSQIFLASFGGEIDDIRHHSTVFSLSNIDDASRISKIFCRLSGKVALDENAPSVFKCFFPNIVLNYAYMCTPLAEDIVIIFKSQSKMLMKKGARNSYFRRLKKHTVWITINPDDSTTFEGGKYIPDEWQEVEGTGEIADDKKIAGLGYGLINT